ncbi:MAG: NAD(P)H-hydrate dehydratase [Desulfotalea sp.]
MELYTGQQVLEMDKKAIIDHNIPEMVLMENAGRSTANEISSNLGKCHGFTLIFIGPGNNGGDGFVVGRHLFQQGYKPIFIILSKVDKLSSSNKHNYEICNNIGLKSYFLDQSKNPKIELKNICQRYFLQGLPCYAIIDAIFGIGLKREITDFYTETINSINEQDFTFSPDKVPVFACDIPSGIDSVSGQALGTAVNADFTISYSHAKPGLFQGQGKVNTGILSICDIGVPITIRKLTPCQYQLTTEDVACEIIHKIDRGIDSHKGKNGHLAIVAGSKNMAGAAILTGSASLYSGTGLTTHIIPNTLNTIFKVRLPEAMTIPLTTSNHISSVDTSIIKKFCADKIMVLGPGMGLKKKTKKCIRNLYLQHSNNIIIDADAITAIASCKTNGLQKTNGDRIFTPHPAEMARLLKCTTQEVQNNRISAVKKFINLFKNCPHDICLILKGEATLIASNKSKIIFINSTGNPSMATGGMGDVLSGIVGSLLAQGLSNIDACICGTFLHGYAADTLEKEIGTGFTASQITEQIPKARKTLTTTTI